MARLQRAKERQSLRGLLQHIQALDFQPGTVIDVGAAYGTQELYETFPNAHHLLIEPLIEYQAALDKLCQQYPHVEVLYAAASYHTDGLTINVHPDLVGSSAYLEEEASDVNGVPRTLPTVRLDTICHKRQLPAPYLIKVDVQGAELEVLRGVTDILKNTEYIVLEVSLFEFYKGAPQFHDVIQYMQSIGFVSYDFTAPLHRPVDDAVSQIDIAFVQANGRFRQHHHYATAEQRQSQNAVLLRDIIKHKAT